MAANGTKFVQHFLGQDGEMVETDGVGDQHMVVGYSTRRANSVFTSQKNIRSDNVMQ